MRINYRLDHRTRRTSLIISIALVLLFAALYLFINDGYLRAWLIAMLLAVVVLYILSIPRYISLKDGILEIHCVVELTRIRVDDITDICRVDRKELKLIPLLGSYGFFGYYGYYADVHQWETLKVYATEWDNLVLIKDIYETFYLVSCRQADKLVTAVSDKSYL
jgi:hypothetical protein